MVQDMLGGILGGQGGPKAALLKGLVGMLSGGQGGGLAGTLSKFQQAGLGQKAQSWIGTGPNDPLEPHEVERALGEDEVAQLADQAGVSRDEVSEHLATLIPETVNHLTPSGEVPDQAGLQQLLQGLG